jgi:type II secretory pathway pseudopilin PulG
MTGAIIAIVIVLIVIGGITISLVSYFRLQRHRADAVAMAAYRKLAEEAVAGQQALEARLGELTARLTAVEELLRSVE